MWKEDWAEARAALTGWWNGTALALSVTAPGDAPREQVPPPDLDVTPERRRLDLDWVLRAEEFRLANTFFGGAALPLFNTDIGGPGSLGLFLGAEGHIDETTVWYEPCILDPENHPPIKFTQQGMWWDKHISLIRMALKASQGRYLVTVPDLVENIDTLAQLRGSQQCLMDLIERPEQVQRWLDEIGQAYIECYDVLWKELQDAWGGSAFYAFQLWGPGKTAKVQCDFCCMISPRMFKRFITPALTQQCNYLDYAMYHLDGTQAIPQLPNLLAIEGIKAIEWTPQAGLPGGGSPQWYELYKQIKAAGKSVQAIDVHPDEVLPLLDAVGPEGMFIHTRTDTEARARQLLRSVGWPTAKGVA